MTKALPDIWLSVIMPTYNGADYIRSTLESLAAQTEGGFEVIAIDEASSDGTPDIIAGYSDRFPIRQIDGAAYPGWVKKTNLGFDNARTPYATMLHQDDVWHPHRMATLRAALTGVPHPVFLVHGVDYIDPRGSPLGKWTLPRCLGSGIIQPTKMLQSLCVQNFIAIPGNVFPAEVARAVGGVDGAMPYTGDWDFYLKIAREVPSLIMRDRLSGYRLHANSLTFAVAADQDRFREQLSLPVTRHLPALGEEDRPFVEAQAAFSNAVNAALAGRMHGVPVPWRQLGGLLKKAGPRGLVAFLDNSRIVQRVLARVRMKFRSKS